MTKDGVRFGEFWLQRKIGVGGMAEVFLARREGPSGFEKQLVVKRLLPHLNQRSKFTKMFLREARYAALIDHPNFAHVSAFGRADDHYYLAMEYVDGVTLRDLLGVVESVTPGVAARIGIDLLDAVHAVHTATDLQGHALHLVHRDITPRNVMVTGSGTVKLLDLGIAVSEDDTAPDRAGTKSYMSPEQAAGRGSLDARSDLFSVGLVMAELLTGLRPKDGSLEVLPSRSPARLTAIVQQLVAVDPNERPRSARDVRDALEDFALGCGHEGTRGFLRKIAEGVVRPATPTSPAEYTASVAEVSEFGPPRPTKILGHAEIVDAGVAAELPTAMHYQRPARRSRAPLLLGLAALGVIVGLVSTWWPSASPPTTVAHRAEARADEPDRVVSDEATAMTSTASSIAEPPPQRVRTRRRPKTRRRVKQRPRPDTPVAVVSAKPGFLNVDARPWANVYVDGRRVGQTPLARFEITPGRHEVRLVNDELQLSATFRVNARSGEIVRVRKRFENQR